MVDFVNIDVLNEYLLIGSCGAIFGVLLPWLFRFVGYLVDVVKIIVLD